MGKGQIFLMVGIVIALTLILLRTSMNLSDIIEEKGNLESGLEVQQFNNVRSEMLNSIGMGYNDGGNMTGNLNDFIRFARMSLEANSADLNCLVVSSYYSTVISNQNTVLNVTVLNFLGSELQNLTLSFDSSNAYLSSIADGMSASMNFTFNTGSDKNYTLSVYYKTSSENRTEIITIPAEIGKSKFLGFIDMKLTSNNQEQADNFLQSYVL